MHTSTYSHFLPWTNKKPLRHMTYGEYVPARIGGLSKPNPSPPPPYPNFPFCYRHSILFYFCIRNIYQIGKNFPKIQFLKSGNYFKSEMQTYQWGLLGGSHISARVGHCIVIFDRSTRSSIHHDSRSYHK